MGYYVDIDFMDPWLIRNAKWNALSDDNKNSWIIYAELMIDNLELNNNYIGEINDVNQEHAFPRNITSEVSSLRTSNAVDTDYYYWWGASYVNSGFYNTWSNLSRSMQTKLTNINDEPKPRVIKESIAVIVDDLIDTDQFRTLVAMQDSGITSMNAGSTSFTFDKKVWNKPLTPKSYKQMFYLMRLWWSTQNPNFLQRL